METIVAGLTPQAYESVNGSALSVRGGWLAA